MQQSLRGWNNYLNNTSDVPGFKRHNWSKKKNLHQQCQTEHYHIASLHLMPQAEIGNMSSLTNFAAKVK